MDWDDFVGFTFCEGSGVGGLESDKLFDEPVSVFSSLFIAAVGFWGGVSSSIGGQQRIYSDWTGLLYAMLTACGLGSSLFHAKFIYAFRYFDEFAMIHIITFGGFVCCCRRLKRPTARYFSAVTLLLFNIAFHEVDIFDPSPDTFRVLFVFAVVALIALIFGTPDSDASAFNQDELRVLKGAFGCLIAGGLCWLADVLLCEYARYFYLHTWWHVFMALAANRLIELNQSKLGRGRFHSVGPCMYVS